MTRTIQNLGSTAVDIAEFYPMPKADLIVVDTTSKPNGDREATYQLVSGNDVYPLSARVGAYPPKSGSALYNTSVRVNTFVLDDAGDEDAYDGCFVTIASGMPHGFVPDKAGMKKLLQHALSLFLPVVLGEVALDSLDELAFGVVSLVAEHADTASA
jgi:hypothetical protein